MQAFISLLLLNILKIIFKILLKILVKLRKFMGSKKDGNFRRTRQAI